METNLTFELPCPICQGSASAVATSPNTPVRWVCQACKVIGLLPPVKPIELPLALLRPVAAA